MFGQVIMAYEGLATLIALVALVVMVDSEVEPVRQKAWSVIISYSFHDTVNHQPQSHL